MLLVNHNTVLGPAATIGRVSRYSGTCLKRPPLGPKLLAALDRWSYYAGSTECKRVINFRTTGSGHNREVVALYRWPLLSVHVDLDTPVDTLVVKPHLVPSTCILLVYDLVVV